MASRTETDKLLKRVRSLELANYKLKRQIDNERGLAQTEAEMLSAHFKLALTAGKLLAAMYHAEVVPSHEMQRLAKSQSDFYVSMYRMRYYLSLLGITVFSRRNIGYWIDSDAKIRIRDILQKEI